MALPFMALPSQLKRIYGLEIRVVLHTTEFFSRHSILAMFAHQGMADKEDEALEYS